jgi:hypothetical protein
MAAGIDHLVILFPNLDDAIETYRKLGFQVLPGGAHPYGTHNALVTFQDGAYLELIAFMEPDKPHDHRWYRFLDRPGLVDYALCVPDVETELERVREAGLDYTGPNRGARERLDGVQLEWRSITPPDNRTEAPLGSQSTSPWPTSGVMVNSSSCGSVGLTGEVAHRAGRISSNSVPPGPDSTFTLAPMASARRA